ncbi:MAG: magnesium transporter [Dokdonella sp.]|uniref:magnesium transporter n=1 Tax=Dokdonella sp. TaxID=2291710 RepID=UPI003265FBE2
MPTQTVTTDDLRALDADDAVARLSPLPDIEVARLLQSLGPGRAVAILDRFGPERRRLIAFAAGQDEQGQWLHGNNWREGSVGRLMEPTPAVFTSTATVAEVIANLRPVVSHTLITYVFVVDAARRLTGLVAFRELAFAEPSQRLSEIMVAQPFSLRPDAEVIDAMREVVKRHYPVYPVCDADGRLLGLVRGAVLFEEQAFEISAQAGAMVGVEREERLTTPWRRALRFRHPWLQLNLVTAFVAASVVGLFQGTVNRIVLLAVFIPVLSGQCSNTGCQALAVTLRGMTLGELTPARARSLLWKEGLLGFLNGALTGLVAAAGMYWLAHHQQHPQALTLAMITFVAMAGSCAVSGFAGAAVPMGLKRLGADPATASSIFLTTATDVISMGLFLGLAAWLIAA